MPFSIRHALRRLLTAQPPTAGAAAPSPAHPASPATPTAFEHRSRAFEIEAPNSAPPRRRTAEYHDVIPPMNLQG
ncbi:hypothetical protein [Chitinibacter tainanensis]|uniref:hypothetical protein n=1 Tax=Chitinibacter tainanensis TaxID=230667 RepID=UPI000416A41C|nr:hypothetical protein [Chitinibacter tainanensis]